MEVTVIKTITKLEKSCQKKSVFNWYAWICVGGFSLSSLELGLQTILENNDLNTAFAYSSVTCLFAAEIGIVSQCDDKHRGHIRAETRQAGIGADIHVCVLTFPFSSGLCWERAL